MSTALIYWQSMNGAHEATPPTMATLATGSDTDWHYNYPNYSNYPNQEQQQQRQLQQRPSYARNWSNGNGNGNGSGNGNGLGNDDLVAATHYQLQLQLQQQQQPGHYLAQIDCQHSVKNFDGIGIANSISSSSFKPTVAQSTLNQKIDRSDSNHHHHSCKLKFKKLC